MNSRNTDNESKVLYREWVPISKFVSISILLLIVLLISIAITTAIFVPQNRVFTLSFCGALSLFFLFMGLNYRGLLITISEEVIKVKYGLLNRKTISVDNLVSYEPTKATFNKYLGFGVRIGTDSSLAFTTSFGDSVKLVIEDSSRPFVFSSKVPQEICELLKVENNSITKLQLDPVQFAQYFH